MIEHLPPRVVGGGGRLAAAPAGRPPCNNRGVPRFFISWLFNIAALALTSALLGRHFELAADEPETTVVVLTFAAVGLIFTLVNVYIAPVIKALSLPFILLTLGLFLLVINALLLMFTAWLAGLVGLSMEISGFWWAVLASVVISLTNSILTAAFGE